MRRVYAIVPLAILTAFVLSIGLSSCKTEEKLSVTENDGSDYALALAELEQELTSFRSRAESLPNSWLALDLTAQKFLQRAQFTGNYQDYAEAEQLLQRAFMLSGELGGPHMTRASLNYSLHRLPLVDHDLDVLSQKIIINDPERARIVGLSADLDFYRGHYESALKGYQDALDLDKTSSNLFRLALYYWHTGNFETGENYLDQALAKNNDASAQLTAFLNLHKGLFDLDRGRYDDALSHYHVADKAFSGWWLIEEHIAEIHTIQGHIEKAKAIYIRIVNSTGNPEFMDALAGIAEEQGDLKSANSWQARAQKVYEQQLATFPEAAYGHALAHYLTLGKQTKEALRLANANYDLRPYGEAQIYLAQAYFQAGEFDKAKEIIEQALSSIWTSAELHATAALIYAKLNADELATLETNKALAVNPFVFDDLLWLGSL